MVRESVLTYADALVESRESTTWSLLRAQNAHLILAILRNQFRKGQPARVDAPVLHERVAVDLEVLRDRGYEVPLSAARCLHDWLQRGFLARRPDLDTGSEYFELSAACVTVLEFVEELGQPTRSATESRLSLVIHMIDRLAHDTDPDASARVERLLRERARIDSQIEAITQGHVDVLTEREALERAREVLALASDVPADFLRVRDQLVDLSIGFRHDVLRSAQTRGDTLESLFSGIDLVAESDAWRSFSAFYALLVDQGQGAELQGNIEAVVSRDFASALSPEDRRSLRRLIRDLMAQAGDVQGTNALIARNLRAFVRDRQFVEQRDLNIVLDAATSRMVTLVEAGADTAALPGVDLELPSIELGTFSRWELRDPADAEPAPDLVLRIAPQADPEALLRLLRETDVDWAELTANVAAVQVRRTAPSVADVLEQHPATQGLASVVGLLVLGYEHGVATEATELVGWTGRGDITRQGIVPQLVFTKDIDANGDQGEINRGRA